MKYFCILESILKYVSPDDEFVIKRNQLLTEFKQFGKQYIVYFDLFVENFRKISFSPIIHLTIGGYFRNYGDRNPSLYLMKNKTMHFTSSINGIPNYWINSKTKLKAHRWYAIKVSQKLLDGRV